MKGIKNICNRWWKIWRIKINKKEQIMPNENRIFLTISNKWWQIENKKKKTKKDKKKKTYKLKNLVKLYTIELINS